MITENVSTLKINKMTQAQYNRELAAGNIKDNEIYLTPIEEEVGDVFFVPWGVSGQEISSTAPEYVYNEVEQAWQDRKSIFFKWHKLRYPGSSLASVQLVMPLTIKDSNNTFWFECIWEGSVLRVALSSDGFIESSSYEINEVEDISDSFIFTPEGDTATYIEIGDVEVYKQGNVISGSVVFDFKPDADMNNLSFVIPDRYKTKTIATTSVYCMNNEVFIAPDSLMAVFENQSVYIKLFDSYVDSATVSFTYVCDLR